MTQPHLPRPTLMCFNQSVVASLQYQQRRVVGDGATRVIGCSNQASLEHHCSGVSDAEFVHDGSGDDERPEQQDCEIGLIWIEP